jgi:hypothetical protein
LPNHASSQQVHGTCLGFQLLHILVSNVSRNDLLIETDSVSHPTTLLWPADGAEKTSRMFGTLPVSGTVLLLWMVFLGGRGVFWVFWVQGSRQQQPVSGTAFAGKMG